MSVNITVGNNVTIVRSACISSEFTDSQLIIGNNTSINEGSHIDYGGDLTIGNDVIISAHTSIYSHDHGTDPKSKPEKISKTIKDNVWIGTNSLILHTARVIGENLIVAAGSVVIKDVPDNVIVAGNSAKVILKLN